MRRTAARKVTNGPPFDDEATKKKLAFVLGRWFDSHFPTAKAHLAICLVGEPRIGEAQVTQTEGVVQASNTVQIETMAGQLLATISAAPHACIDELKSQLCSLIGESVHNQHLFVSGSDEELSGTDPLPAGTDKLILVRSEPIMAFFGATGGTQWRNTKKSRLGLCGPGKKHWGSAAPMGKWAGVRHVAGEGVLALALPYNNLRGRLPRSVWSGFPNLKALSLPNNKLTGPIPSEIMQCVNIHTLNLRHNLLTGPVPSEIAHLTKLAALDLSLNKQLTVPDGVPLATDYDDLYYDNPTSCTAFTTAMRDKYPALQ